MEMKFNSQICTTREQGARLLALGLKKETADCGIYYSELMGDDRIFVYVGNGYEADEIPAWSLHRLIEICNHKEQDLNIVIPYARTYDAMIARIKWLIKEGYFPKEYLVDQETIEEHCKGVLEYLDYIREEEE